MQTDEPLSRGSLVYRSTNNKIKLANFLWVLLLTNLPKGCYVEVDSASRSEVKGHIMQKLASSREKKFG